MQKFTTLLGTILAASFLIGLATTLTRSSMIGFFDVLPVYILMAIAIFMMVYEAFFDKKKLSKYMQNAIVKGNKHSAKDYAEAIDFMKRSYESYEEVFEDYHGVLSPASPGVAPKGLKSTGTAEFNKVWSYLGTPCISLPLLQGESNMPLGVQLIGARYDDNRFLGIANWLEKECNK